MSRPIPLVRHGLASTQDPRLVETLAIAQAAGLEADDRLISLLDYDDQLWATWRDRIARARGASVLTQAWEKAGGGRGALHLVPSEEDYDYQEDCMNDASE